MNVNTAILRSVLAVFLGIAALAELFTGSFLGAVVMLAGCFLISPPGGA